ncbi:hypothetical protein Pan153_63280 [Gimesia panareensis]|uniref:Uncharacterized protein n=1 Tax=Gimesia panareensis TaxID=2527978 RepID=A0A518FZ40_9PLAN|nr:hypothetical protein [Gimesia panareensis]QDV21638.1 hypothetical protein Pan153_63280 [Gimesia panareensis]
MGTHFSQLFWGLLIVLLDFSINGFDLLPDGVGYLIMAAGCYGLASLSPRFLTAQTLCLVLAVLWLIHFAIDGTAAVFFKFLMQVVNCVMIWQLLGGIREFALSKTRQDLARRAENRRLAYVALLAVSTILAIGIQDSPEIAPVAIVPVIALLVLIVMILHLIHRVKVELVAPERLVSEPAVDQEVNQEIEE